MKKRCSGILMPVSSLPGGYGIGSMGQAARDFVDFLALAGQSVWRATRILLTWISWLRMAC